MPLRVPAQIPWRGKKANPQKANNGENILR